METSAPRPPEGEEQTVYGVKASLALLEHRPADLLRLYHAPALRGQLGAILSWAAARRIPYRELDAESLRKTAGSPHHEGLVVVSRPLRYRPCPRTLAVRAAEARHLWLALDGVANPHNLGAIVRSCAFFGVTGLLVGGAAAGDKVNGAVLRVAEGGAEHVTLYGAPTLSGSLRQLRRTGFRVLGLESDAALALPAALREGGGAGPLVLVLGQEREGLAAATRTACDALCAIHAHGAMASLNVSVAAGVALAEAMRCRA